MVIKETSVLHFGQYACNTYRVSLDVGLLQMDQERTCLLNLWLPSALVHTEYNLRILADASNVNALLLMYLDDPANQYQL
jgi:hypothetical protein